MKPAQSIKANSTKTYKTPPQRRGLAVAGYSRRLEAETVCRGIFLKMSLELDPEEELLFAT